MNTILPTIIRDTKFKVLIFMKKKDSPRCLQRQTWSETSKLFDSYDEAKAWAEELRSDLFYTILAADIIVR